MIEIIQKLIRRLLGQEDSILQELVLIKQQNLQIMDDLSRLKEAVERDTAVVQSAVTLINGMAEQIRNLPVGDQDAINELADRLNGQSDELAKAVEANTPASTE